MTIADAGIRAADAGGFVARALAEAAEPWPERGTPVTVIAAGKAAVPMAEAFARLSGVRIAAGLAVSTHAALDLPVEFEWHQAGHPVPTEASERAGRRALDLAAHSEFLVVLLSGGASALLAVPADAITLDDKRGVTARLLRAGADITALNTVRKHLSAIKGGQLAAASRGATLAWAVSDVMGDDLSVIASGPTVADPTTFADALQVLDRFGGRSAYPPSVTRRLDAGARGELSDTPKPDDPRLHRTSTRIIGSRRDVLAAARSRCEQLGYRAILVDEPVTGEARAVAPRWIERAATLAGSTRERVAVLSTGETTVRVRGTGRGGRNQEFVLAAVAALAGLGRPAVVASVGTDGIDGPTDAAGAVADGETASRLLTQGMSARATLDNNDSYPLFAALGDLIVTGPTNTNVGDLQVLLLG